MAQNKLKIGGTYRLGKYHPYRGGSNPSFDRFSGMILDVKADAPGDKARAIAVNHFAQQLHPLLPDDAAVAYVPSSKPAKTSTGMREISQQLSTGGRTDATACIVRTKEIPSLHTGGNRNKDVHLKSIQIRSTELIRDRDVVLLDDVTTSGNSLAACKQLLLQAGARSVTTLALGETTHE